MSRDYTHYRKYLQPEYGEAAPDAIIMPSQYMDLNHPTRDRIRMNFETIAELTAQWKNCYCYRHIMAVDTINTTIPTVEGPVPVRIYLPGGSGPFPTLVFYHGGGWSMNSLDVYDFVPRYLSKYGKLLVIAPEYRLAPEHRFPAGLHDAYASLVWAAEHAGEYGGTPEKLSVCGDSAGGNLAAAVALMARDSAGPATSTQILIYPATVLGIGYRTASELRYGDGGYFLEKNSALPTVSPYLADGVDAASPYASPLLAEDLRGLPPACFLSAECDPILDQALMYAARLEDAGIPVEYHLYQGMVHAFINRPQQKTFEALDMVSAAADRA